MKGMCCPLESCCDNPEEFDYSFPIAEADYRCEECGETIPQGAKHELYMYVSDGDMSWARTCMSCQEIRDHFSCDGYIIGQLWNDLRENFFPDMKAGGPCMDGLSPPAKSRLFEERLRWVFDHDEYEPCDRALPPSWQERRQAWLQAEYERELERMQKKNAEWAEFQRTHPQIALPDEEA